MGFMNWIKKLDPTGVVDLIGAGAGLIGGGLMGGKKQQQPSTTKKEHSGMAQDMLMATTMMNMARRGNPLAAAYFHGSGSNQDRLAAPFGRSKDEFARDFMMPAMAQRPSSGMFYNPSHYQPNVSFGNPFSNPQPQTAFNPDDEDTMFGSLVKKGFNYA